MRRIVLGITMLGVIGLLVAPMAYAQKAPKVKYEGGTVSDGGTLTGKVLFKGNIPAPKTFELLKFPNVGFCEKSPNADGKGNVLLKEVSVGADGALQDVVIYIPSIMKGKAFDFKGTDVKANQCRFLAQGGPSTFSGVTMNKAEFRVLNTDADPNDPKAATGVLHNPHAYEITGVKSKTIFNVPLPNKGQMINKKMKLRKVKKGSFVKLECDQHNFMNAYFLPVQNPYYAIVGEDGSFSIDGIPAGEYEVQAWHPTLGRVSETITVAAGGTASASFTFEK